MRWRDQRRSSNVEDRRGRGGGGRVAIGGGSLGFLILILLIWLCGGDVSSLLDQAPNQQTRPTQTQSQPGQQDDEREFVSVVLASTEDTWNQIFERNGSSYRDPVLVLYSGQTRSACGFGSAAMGPFYCPGDQKLYLDLTFLDELRTKFQAPGDFAAAYVIAHEVGHHVQNLTGEMSRVSGAQRRATKTQANKLSVRLELQADCYAGVWASSAKEKGLLDEGDVEEALNAAQSVGDDMIQKRSQGYVVPESFTHGSSRERSNWFSVGMDSGNPDKCNTFN